MTVLWEMSAAECLCSGQYEIVGLPLFPRRLKTAVKFHYYTYPRKNDHERFTHFAFIDLLFFQEGKYDWFSYGQLVFLWLIFPVGGKGGGGLEVENYTKLKINNPPRILQLCGQVCLV